MKGLVGIFGVLALIMASAAPLAHADTITTLSTVTSDEFPGMTSLFSATTDVQGDITGFGYTEEGSAPTQFALTSLRGNGSVILRKDNREVIRVRMDANFSAQHGGMVFVNFLYNGITGARRECQMELVRNGSHWDIYAAPYGRRAPRPFGAMFIAVRRILGTKVGISFIRTT